MKEPLIKERNSIQNSKLGIFLDVDNDLWLEGQGLGVRKNHVIELSYIDHCSAFLLALSIKLSDNKDRKTEWVVLRHVHKTTKAMHLVKFLVNELANFVSQRVNPRLDGGYPCLRARLEWHFHLVLRWYLDKAFRFPNGGILSIELSQ